MDNFDEISQSLQPHPSQAQILLGVEEEGNTLDEALGILKAHEVKPIEYAVIRDGESSFVLFYLSPHDMKGAILNLTEAGFTRLKGINAQEIYPKK
jgi:hypothetical protein